MGKRGSIISLLCRGAKLEEGEKLTALNLLETTGYRARLVDLADDLARFNGKRVNPIVLLRYQQYLIKLKDKLPDGREEDLELVVPPHKLVVEIDRYAQVWQGVDFKNANASPHGTVANHKISSVR